MIHISAVRTRPWHDANDCREGPNSPPLTLHQNQDIPPEEKEDPGLERVGERKKLGVLKMMMMMILLFQQLLFFSLSFFIILN